MLITISGLKCTLPAAFTYEANFPEENLNRGQNPDPLKENGNLVTSIGLNSTMALFHGYSFSHAYLLTGVC